MNFLIATNEPLGADKNSLDWWKAKKEEYPTLARLAMKNLCVSWKIFFVNTEHLHLPVIVWILDANWLLCILLFDQDKEKVIIGG